MGRYGRLLVLPAAMLVLTTISPPAYAAVTITRASVSGSQLRVEGMAIANRDITVDGVVMGRSSSSGRIRITRNGYTRPADCTIDVNDGSATPRVATLSGCTVTQPPPPPPPASPQITPQVAELGPGFVGADFTTFSATTSTLTFGPDALGPVAYDVIAGQLPAGLQLVEQNDGSSPNKRVNASVTGTPTTVQASTFTARATDANGLTATRTYTIRINPARTLEITPQQWAPLAVGEFSNLWIDGVGGVRPYTWVRSAGQLPPGMSLVQDNPDGPLVRVTGTPTTAGTFTFTLRLTDAQGTTVTRTFSVTVPEPDTSTGPAAPTLLAPADGASVATPFTIDWTEEFDPTLSANGGYNWQVSSTSTFSTLALSDSTLPTVTQDTISGIPNGTYFWRVQAVDGQLRSSPFSQPHRFTITGTTPDQPGSSTLSLPPYGSSFHPFEHFRFTWTAAERAVKYEFLASKNSSFPAGSIKIDNIESTSTGLTIGDFCGGCEQGTYFARVIGIDANGVRGLPSNTVTFTISYNAPLPPAPTALSPANGATVSLPVTLDWSDVPNPQDTGYEIEISRNSSFSDIEDHIPQITPSVRQVLSLTSGTKWWRVRSHQGNASATTSAVTEWSTPRSFTIPSGAPQVESVWLGAPPCQNPCPGADSLFSGQEIEGSIQLSSAAPAGGAVVNLTSNPASGASHPASVTVPAGAAFATFRLFAGEVSQPTPVTLTGTLGSSSASFLFTVNPTTVKRLSFCCDSTGGLPAAAHLEFTGEVPTGGLTVALSSSSPLANPPNTVTAAAGAFSLPISIPTSEVTATTTVTISATLNGTTVTAPLRLYPQQPPTSLVLDRSETNGTAGANGTVRIATGQNHEVLMKITSSNPAIARPQPYAQIPFLGTVGPFNIATEPPATSTDVTISATGAGVTLTTTLTVHPVGGPTGGPSISTLGLSPSTVTGGNTSTGTVSLSAPAPSGGASVSLSSGNAAAATVPAGVTVPAGATSATFAVTSKNVTASTSVQITGVYGGVARGAALTVTPATAPPAPTASAVSLSPGTVTSGATSTGTVTLTSAAPSGGAAVTLASSNTGVATVPASVTVAAGATSATFSVTSRSVTSTSTSTISASYGGATRTAVLTVNPPAPAGDTVTIQRAEYDGRLRVDARSTSSSATLRVFVASTGALIGTMSNDGGGRYRGEFNISSNPQNIRVTSSLGGSATSAVTN